MAEPSAEAWCRWCGYATTHDDVRCLREERDALEADFKEAVDALIPYLQAGGTYAHLMALGESITRLGPQRLVEHFASVLAEKDAALTAVRPCDECSDGYADDDSAEDACPARGTKCVVSIWRARRRHEKERADQAERERDEAREVVAKVNNSFGCYAYFTNPHPADQVETLKTQCRDEYQRVAALEADLAVLRGALEMARRTLMAWNRIGWQNGGVSKAQADELNKLYEGAPEIRAIDAALASSPGAAWLVTALDVVKALRQNHDYDHERESCLTCALLARPDVRRMKG